LKRLDNLLRGKRALLKRVPNHPSLHQEGRPILVGTRRTALSGTREEVDGGLLWFWIGSHGDYDAMIG
jgi:hypothetical protein